jgi:hypothetical protein
MSTLKITRYTRHTGHTWSSFVELHHQSSTINRLSRHQTHLPARSPLNVCSVRSGRSYLEQRLKRQPRQQQQQAASEATAGDSRRQQATAGDSRRQQATAATGLRGDGIKCSDSVDRSHLDQRLQRLRRHQASTAGDRGDIGDSSI